MAYFFIFLFKSTEKIICFPKIADKSYLGWDFRGSGGIFNSQIFLQEKVGPGRDATDLVAWN